MIDLLATPLIILLVLPAMIAWHWWKDRCKHDWEWVGHVNPCDGRRMQVCERCKGWRWRKW